MTSAQVVPSRMRDVRQARKDAFEALPPDTDDAVEYLALLSPYQRVKLLSSHERKARQARRAIERVERAYKRMREEALEELRKGAQ